MSKKLNLIRHSYAESSSGSSDFERSLTSQGMNAVRDLGRFLIKSAFNPSVILCSSAVRAKQTVQHLIEELEINEKSVLYKDVIYNASVRELLQEINLLKEEVNEVALVGHNPTITYLAELLTGESLGNMDPCGMATITFSKLKWEEISQAAGKLESYIHPKHSNV